MKKFYAAVLAMSILLAMGSSVSANTITYLHGNNNSTKTCYAKVTQTDTDLIGAQITWQLSTSNTVYYGPFNTGTGYNVTSSSSNLNGKSGKSYGYFYHNNTNKPSHRSTDWFSFNFT